MIPQLQSKTKKELKNICSQYGGSYKFNDDKEILIKKTRRAYHEYLKNTPKRIKKLRLQVQYLSKLTKDYINIHRDFLRANKRIQKGGTPDGSSILTICYQNWMKTRPNLLMGILDYSLRNKQPSENINTLLQTKIANLQLIASEEIQNLQRILKCKSSRIRQVFKCIKPKEIHKLLNKEISRLRGLKLPDQAKIEEVAQTISKINSGVVQGTLTSTICEKAFLKIDPTNPNNNIPISPISNNDLSKLYIRKKISKNDCFKMSDKLDAYSFMVDCSGDSFQTIHILLIPKIDNAEIFINIPVYNVELNENMIKIDRLFYDTSVAITNMYAKNNTKNTLYLKFLCVTRDTIINHMVIKDGGINKIFREGYYDPQYGYSIDSDTSELNIDKLIPIYKSITDFNKKENLWNSIDETGSNTPLNFPNKITCMTFNENLTLKYNNLLTNPASNYQIDDVIKLNDFFLLVYNINYSYNNNLNYKRGILWVAMHGFAFTDGETGNYFKKNENMNDADEADEVMIKNFLLKPNNEDKYYSFKECINNLISKNDDILFRNFPQSNGNGTEAGPTNGWGIGNLLPPQNIYDMIHSGSRFLEEYLNKHDLENDISLYFY